MSPTSARPAPSCPAGFRSVNSLRPWRDSRMPATSWPRAIPPSTAASARGSTSCSAEIHRRWVGPWRGWTAPRPRPCTLHSACSATPTGGTPFLPRPSASGNGPFRSPSASRRPGAVWPKTMDVPRVGSVWTLHLTNWTMRDRPGGAPYRPDELCASTVAIARNWLAPPVDRDLENFSTSFVLLEAEGAVALKALVDAIECAAARWVEGTTAGLVRLRAAIATMTRRFAMSVRKRTVDPAIWLELIQPTFAWAAYRGPFPAGGGGAERHATRHDPGPRRRPLRQRTVITGATGRIRPSLHASGPPPVPGHARRGRPRAAGLRGGRRIPGS